VKLGRVVGTVVSTINSPAFDDRTLLLCDLLEPSGEPAGGYVIAVDTVGAGAGEVVLILDEGNSARQILGLAQAPIRTIVAGIVDEVVLDAGRATAPPPATRSPTRRTARPRTGRMPGPAST
jgi:ethanolamine utilization protein EutN